MTLSNTRRNEILETVNHLRVTDIRDGLDWMGHHHLGTVSPEIRPLWRTKAAGFALTMRHVPTQEPIPRMSPEEYTHWAYDYWYGKKFAHQMSDDIDDTTFMVIDTCDTPTPAVGSNDSMQWAYLGARGVLTNGGARDTDETLETKHLPVWSRWIVQPMYQGRVEWGGHGMPVQIGGQTIATGDLVVADGDGAVVVPEAIIDGVLKYAIQESEQDKITRAMIFEAMGYEQNESTRSVFDVEPHPYADVIRAKVQRRLNRS